MSKRSAKILLRQCGVSQQNRRVTTRSRTLRPEHGRSDTSRSTPSIVLLIRNAIPTSIYVALSSADESAILFQSTRECAFGCGVELHPPVIAHFIQTSAGCDAR